MSRSLVVLCGLILGSAVAGQWTGATPIRFASDTRSAERQLVSFEGEPLKRIVIHQAAGDAVELCFETRAGRRCAPLSAYREGLDE